MGAAERAKGARGERDLVNELKSAGIPAVRVSPLEAGNAAKGDVMDGSGNKWQVKRRGRRPALYDWLEGFDRLALRSDREDWLVVMPLDAYCDMVSDVEKWRKVAAVNHGDPVASKLATAIGETLR